MGVALTLNSCPLAYADGTHPVSSAPNETLIGSFLDITKVQDLHLHDPRHTFSTSMVQAGIDLYKFQIEPEILMICRVARQFLQYQPRINLSGQSKKPDPPSPTQN